MLNVSMIEHFSTGDGPGIRTTVFLKGCNLHCPWCHNPETLSAESVTLTFQNGKKVTYGKQMTVQEVLNEVLPDRDFYLQSGGGVTFSGGEAMLQSAEILPLAKALYEENIDLLIDTAADVSYSCFELLNPYVSTYYVDIKTADSGAYRTVCGGNIERICDNIRHLKEDGKTLHIRIPVIPGFNTANEQIRELCSLIGTLGVRDVDLLFFHRLGTAKYEAMGLDYQYAKCEPLSKIETEKIANRYREYFNVRIEY